MAAAVSDRSWLLALLQFEVALVRAKAQLGLLSQILADEIVAACDPATFDIDAIGLAAVGAGNPVVPLIDELKRRVSGDAVAHVHHGATSQDALDTAMMLVSRSALDLLLADLSALAAQCVLLAGRHRNDPMIGRTLLQSALPITFGLKCANWLMGVVEARRLLSELKRNRLTVQLGGPVGTLDAFAGRGFELVEAMASQLGMPAPELPWHTSRGRVAELGAGLAIAGGAAAKIALDVLLLSQDEVGEVSEANWGRSSSMSHKRNQVHAVEARAAFDGAAAQAGLLLRSIPGEHERAAGPWQAEWPAVSEAFRLAAGAVNRTTETLTGLRVDTIRMRQNLLRGSAGTADSGAAQEIIDRALVAYERS
ncbi:MAG: lyase family protein [Candidatus Dormibacteraceae bacterium]